MHPTAAGAARRAVSDRAGGAARQERPSGKRDAPRGGRSHDPARGQGECVGDCGGLNAGVFSVCLSVRVRVCLCVCSV